MSDKVKPVSFKVDDADIIKHLKSNGYDKVFSYYVKGLIRKDMNNNIAPVKEEVKKPRKSISYEYEERK